MEPDCSAKKPRLEVFEEPKLYDDKGREINIGGAPMGDGEVQHNGPRIIHDGATLLKDGVMGRIFSLSNSDDMGIQLVFRYNKLHAILGTYKSGLSGGMPQPIASESWMTKKGLCFQYCRPTKLALLF